MDAAKRATWKAGLLGAAIAAMAALILLLGFFIAGMTTTARGSYAALGFAIAFEFLLTIGVPSMALLGGVFGAALLRKRRRLRHALWIIPVATIPTTMLICIVGIYLRDHLG